MPAPLGKTPTKKMPKIDVFGREDSRSTRAAVRFFRDRRIVVRFVDLGKQAMDAGDFRQFLDRLGAAGLLAEPGAEPPGPDAPAAHGSLDRGALLAQVRSDSRLLRLPLVRHGNELTAGPAEDTWRNWLARHSGPNG